MIPQNLWIKLILVKTRCVNTKKKEASLLVRSDQPPLSLTATSLLWSAPTEESHNVKSNDGKWVGSHVRKCIRVSYNVNMLLKMIESALL